MGYGFRGQGHFADLYHQRWRIEEAFKRLKHRLKLEAVSGLSQQALLIDVVGPANRLRPA